MRSCHYLMWLVVLLAVHCFPHVGGLTVSQFYPFGAAADDQILERSDQGSSSGINLATPFIFFGTTHSVVYVSRSLHELAGFVYDHDQI